MVNKNMKVTIKELILSCEDMKVGDWSILANNLFKAALKKSNTDFKNLVDMNEKIDFSNIKEIEDKIRICGDYNHDLAHYPNNPVDLTADLNEYKEALTKSILEDYCNYDNDDERGEEISKIDMDYVIDCGCFLEDYIDEIKERINYISNWEE
jgi:hypothetical protein